MAILPIEFNSDQVIKTILVKFALIILDFLMQMKIPKKEISLWASLNENAESI